MTTCRHDDMTYDEGRGVECVTCTQRWPPAALVQELDNERSTREALERRLDEVRGERDALRQAHWDGRAIGGFDNDGDPTPRAVVSDFCSLIRGDWQQMREDVEDARKETDAAEAERDALAEALREWNEADEDMGPMDSPYSPQGIRLRLAKERLRALAAPRGDGR